MRLLDIGCGFGGLLIFAAEHYGITGTGVTISHAHCKRGNAQISRRGLKERIHLELRDYRKIRSRYERIVSVGMMEHVPRSEYETYFREIARALTPGGIGLVHTIGCTAAVNRHDPFIQKYISRLEPTPTIRDNRVHGETWFGGIGCGEHRSPLLLHLLGWLARFQQKRSTLDPNRYDAVFQRMWEYYLSCGIAAAGASDAAVYQVLFHNDRSGDIPLKRVSRWWRS